MSLDITDLWQYNLRKGNTSHPRNGACLFDAGMWLVYGQIGDNPPCSCPIIRSYAISLNDEMPDDQRQRLKPFILRVVGNRDPSAEAERLRFLVLETARRVVPLAFEGRWPKLAGEMRALPDLASFGEMRALMFKANSIATSAGAFGKAHAHAAANAVATSTAAATYAASSAAWAAAYAANAVATSTASATAVWDQAIWILDNVLRIGKQSPEFDEAEVRASVERFKRAREVA